MADKSEKRQQTTPLQIRMRPVERNFLEEAAQKLSDQSPSKVGVGPFLRWAGLREAEKLVGMSLADYENAATERAKGIDLRHGVREVVGKKRGKGGSR